MTPEELTLDEQVELLEKEKADLQEELKKQKKYSKGLLTQIKNLEEALSKPKGRPVYGRSL